MKKKGEEWTGRVDSRRENLDRNGVKIGWFK